MKNFEQYKETFSQVQSNSVLKIEDVRGKKGKKGHIQTGKMKVAVVVLVGLFGIGTFVHASGTLGLRNLLIRSDEESAADSDTSDDGTAKHRDAAGGTVTPDLNKAVSLQGYVESNEYQASKEWNEFLSQYDPDFVKHTDEEEDRIKKEQKEKWLMYSVYTQEMVEKLDEIADKYDLDLHRANQNFSDNSAFDRLSRTSGLLGLDNVVMDGYLYNNGTFQFDGESSENAGRFSYQFRRCVKGTFDVALLYLESSNMEEYREEVYRTAGGQDVTISVDSEGKVIAIANLENSFMTLHVVDKGAVEDVKKVLDSFDFAALDEIGM